MTLFMQKVNDTEKYAANEIIFLLDTQTAATQLRKEYKFDQTFHFLTSFYNV